MVFFIEKHLCYYSNTLKCSHLLVLNPKGPLGASVVNLENTADISDYLFDLLEMSAFEILFMVANSHYQLS